MRRGPSLSWRFMVMVAVLLVVVLVSSGGFWLSALSRDSAAMRESRFQFSLNSVRAALEGGLHLGLLLQGLPGGQTLIDRHRAEDRDILSIDVFDDAGRILFSTDSGGVAALVPEAWRAPCLAARQAPWQGEDDIGALQCLSLVNGFEKTVGGVVMRYRTATRTDLLSVLLQRWHAGAALWLALLAVAGGAGWLAYRRVERKLDAARAALAAEGVPGKSTTIQGAARESAVVQGAVLGGLAAGTVALAAVSNAPGDDVRAALAARERELDAADREADRLDDLDLG